MSTWRMLQECQGTCEITTFSYKVQHNKKWINRVKIFQVESNLHTHTHSLLALHLKNYTNALALALTLETLEKKLAYATFISCGREGNDAFGLQLQTI